MTIQRKEVIGDATIYLADYQDIMPLIPERSVRALLTDPPYGATNNAWDVRPDLTEFWKHALRVAMPKACIAFTCAGAPVAQFIMSNPDMYRYDIVYEKTSVVGFLDSKRRPLHAHELILIFCDARDPAVYNPQRWHKPGASAYYNKNKIVNSSNYGLKKIKYTVSSPDDTRCAIDVVKCGLQFNRVGRLKPDGNRYNPQSIYNIDPHLHKVHPTQKPSGLYQWLVKSYSNPGELIVDPFMGSGTTGVAALREGRKFIGCDSDPWSFEKTSERMHIVMEKEHGAFQLDDCNLLAEKE